MLSGQLEGPASVNSARGAIRRWARSVWASGLLTIVSWCVVAAGWPTPAAAGEPPVNVSPPTISGTAEAGNTLVGTRGTWSNAAALGDGWQRCDAIGGACTSTDVRGRYYTLTAADLGHTMVLLETARSATGDTASQASSPTSVVTVASTTALVALPPSPVANQTVTIVATVTASVLGAPPSGSVTFTSDGSALRGCSNEPVNATGQSVTVVCQASFPRSTSQLMATFAPAAGSYLIPSSSATQSLTVGKDSTSTSLDVSPTAEIGASTTYTATVSPPGVRPGPLKPTGSVDFFDGATPIASCSRRPLILGGATCTVRYTTLGPHTITTRYGGDANFTGSASAPAPLTVAAPPPNVLGLITATMQWGFHYTRTYTTVTALRINGALKERVIVQCAGRGCPFTEHTTLLTATQHCGLQNTRTCRTPGTLDLTRKFGKRRLAVGTKITVMITRPRWIGKSYSFTIRAAHGPRIRLGCLAPGSVRSGVGC